MAFRPPVQVSISRAAIEAVYDECDRYDHDETGGRVLGTFKVGRRGRVSVEVTGVIEPGPNARRTATSFFQDGEYQESVFRALETQHPEIEHLGNWHTHHVNGYPTLSSGDRQTYHRIVNHPLHNTDYFYALLVTARNKSGSPRERYETKHFILRRNTPGEYEVPSSAIKIIDRPAIWPDSKSSVMGRQGPSNAIAAAASDQRARDNQFLQEFQPTFRPYRSKTTGSVYWRGDLGLINEASVEVIVAELEDEDGERRYGAMFKDNQLSSTQFAHSLPKMRFRSAIEACLTVESGLNREIYRACESELLTLRHREGGK